MREIHGDIWETPGKYRVVTTNGQIKRNGRLVMGKGIALQARERYPGLDQALGNLVATCGNHTIVLHDKGLVSFPTKHDWRDMSDIELIRRSALELSHLLHCVLRKEDIVLLPPPGCGNGGLMWEEVRPVIAPLLDDHYIVVHYA